MLIIYKCFWIYGEVTYRNHQAYSWGHLVHNNTVRSIYSAAVCDFASSKIILLKTLAVPYLSKSKTEMS